MGRGDENTSDAGSLSSGSSESSCERKRRKRRRHNISSDSESEYSSSEDDSRKRRKKKRKQKHKREKKPEKSSEKKRKRDKHESRKLRKSRKHRHHHHHPSGDEQDEGRESNRADTQAKLQVTMQAREQEKLLIYQNAQLAKARLNGELREVQAQQAKLQDMYGTIDWRARKKLRIEKKKLERSVAAGKKLAQIEEEENARMDAFRIALGLPTAEAQRQAEWRAEATRALAHEPQSGGLSTKSSKKAIIGPQLPR